MSVDVDLFNSVCNHAREAALWSTTADTLEWDERTGMPSGAAEYRVKQITALRAMAHKVQTDDAFGENLKTLADQSKDLDPQSDQVATVRGLLREWTKNRKLPTQLVERMAAARTRGQQVWDQARAEDDFSIFRDSLRETIDLQREAGGLMADGTDQSIYDALLDTYEPNAKSDEIQKVFDGLRPPLVKLIAEIAEAPNQPKIEILKRDFPIDAQRDFARLVAEKVGYSFTRGRLDETSHPFCTTLGPSDCRILTRYLKNWFPSGLFGMLHEAGHGMYEQGLRTSDWFGLPPGSYTSLGVHESQSRLWENQVGRSREFWEWLYPEAQKRFDALRDVSLDDFYFAINAIGPSLIRVEADEATYNLHIMIRFDLERQLIDGSLTVDDLPEAWHARYQSDLGIRAPSDANGVLQDVHWSAGLFGYFPTYTLGNLIGAQIYHAAQTELGDLGSHYRNGEFMPLLSWLNQNVHHLGQTCDGNELVQKVTDKPLSHEYLLDHLIAKAKPLYRIG